MEINTEIERQKERKKEKKDKNTSLGGKCMVFARPAHSFDETS